MIDKYKKLKEQFQSIDELILDKKVEYFEKISENIPIAVRIIVDRDDISYEQKNEAFRLLSEFQHEINKIKNLIKSVVGFKFNLVRIAKYIKFAAEYKDSLIANEIAFCLKTAYKNVNFKNENYNENYLLKPSLYYLLEDKNISHKLKSLIGDQTINNLEGFIKGYFYAIDSNEIRMHGTRGYPNLREIDKWFMNDKNTMHSDWKIYLENNVSLKGNLIERFLTVYRNRITKFD